MSKPLLVVFEGVDKSGKTTLLNAVNKQLNYLPVMLDRSPISSIVYCEAYKRGATVKHYYEKLWGELCASCDILVVFCHASEKIIAERLKAHKETLPKQLANITEIQNKFMKFIYNRWAEDGFSVLMVNTEAYNIDESVKLIIEKLHSCRLHKESKKIKDIVGESNV